MTWSQGPSCNGGDLRCNNFDIKTFRVVPVGTRNSEYFCYGCSLSRKVTTKALQQQLTFLVHGYHAGSRYMLLADGHFGRLTTTTVGVIAGEAIGRGVIPPGALYDVIAVAQNSPTNPATIRAVAAYMPQLLAFFRDAADQIGVVKVPAPDEAPTVARGPRVKAAVGFLGATAFLLAATFFGIAANGKA